MVSRARKPELLGGGGDEREDAGDPKRDRAIAAKLRAARHLPANAADVAESFVQIIHDRHTLQCKVDRGIDIRVKGSPACMSGPAWASLPKAAMAEGKGDQDKAQETRSLGV